MRKVFILLLYRILPPAAFPLLLLYVVWRSVRDPRYFRRITERFGFLPTSFKRTAPDSVWLHAVSVGEVLSSIHLVSALRREMPDAPVFISCSTLAGREVAESKLASLVDGIFFAPIDYVSCVRRVLRRIRPCVVVVLETEIWPNLYREVKRSGAALVVVNGRISPKALPRYRRLAWFFRTVLAEPDAILVQSAEDRERYIQAGAPADRVMASGNLKYDFDPKGAEPPEAVREWLAGASGPLWIAASTVAPEYSGDVDEDDVVIEAYREVSARVPGLRLLVAPRKPERFEVVAAKMAAAGLDFVRRSEWHGGMNPSVLLLDSLGELGSVFPHADVVFMGGTLADRGGHNILEPAFSGRPIIVGPHLENFSEIQRHFRAGAGFHEISDSGGLAAAVVDLLSNKEEREALGRRAHALAEAERGATARAVRAIADAREDALPRVVSFGPLKPVLWLLCGMWRAGGWIGSAISRPARLHAPVVSVGGLSMGGSGKTPLVRHLARRLHADGIDVAVLTRGYRRRSSEPVTILPRGSSAPTEITGDEPQMILRDGAAHLGIGSDRAASGARMDQSLHPAVFLLDDGFQHKGVHKDLDIVLLDGMDPFAGGYVFPRGRLREPASSLSRAGAVVITRARGRRFTGLHRAIRSVNPDAPIFHTDLVARAWVDARTGERFPTGAFTAEKTAAFCGLANPQSFWRTLASLGYIPEWFRVFPDHHPYTGAELQELAARAAGAILLTTEKDAVKLPANWSASSGVFWLEVDVEVEPGLYDILQIKRKVTIV